FRVVFLRFAFAARAFFALRLAAFFGAALRLTFFAVFRLAFFALAFFALVFFALVFLAAFAVFLAGARFGFALVFAPSRVSVPPSSAAFSNQVGESEPKKLSRRLVFWDPGSNYASVPAVG